MDIKGGNSMIYCEKCGKELSNDSLFCNKCGFRIGGNIQNEIKPKKFNKKVMLFSALGVILVGAIVVVVVMLANNPIGDFKDAIAHNNYLQATSIYDEKLKGNVKDETETITFLNGEIEQISKGFTENKIEYSQALIQLATIEKTDIVANEVDAAINEIDKLNDSRTSFKLGNELLASKNYKDALSELKKVTAEDNNYNSALELINSSNKEYKASILSEAEAAAKENNYENAISLLNGALILVPNDSDLTVKKTSYEKLNEEKQAKARVLKLAELKNSQEVIVTSVSQYTDIIDTNFISVKVKNNTEKKTVKNYQVGFMAFDSNNLPVKVGLGSSDYVGSGSNDQNILPGQELDSHGGWYLDNHSAKKLIACIKQVVYYDGTEWTNPYYEYWLEEYQEKPLH
jgi:tetratricopeptide (TPR) repeat protein